MTPSMLYIPTHTIHSGSLELYYSVYAAWEDFKELFIHPEWLITIPFHSWFSRNTYWEINLSLFSFLKQLLLCCLCVVRKPEPFSCFSKEELYHFRCFGLQETENPIHSGLNNKGICCVITQNQSWGLVNFLAHEVLVLFPRSCSQPTSLGWLAPFRIIRCCVASLHMSGCPGQKGITVDPWAARVCTVGVHLYMDFFFH